MSNKEDIYALLMQGKTAPEVAEILNLNRVTVYKHIKDNGWPTNSNALPRGPLHKQLVKGLLAGWPHEVLCEMFSVSEGALSRLTAADPATILRAGETELDHSHRHTREEASSDPGHAHAVVRRALAKVEGVGRGEDHQEKGGTPHG